MGKESTRLRQDLTLTIRLQAVRWPLGTKAYHVVEKQPAVAWFQEEQQATPRGQNPDLVRRSNSREVGRRA